MSNKTIIEKGADWKPEYMNATALAEEMGVSPRTVCRWVKEGCPFLNVGGHSKKGRRLRFNLDKVVAWRDALASVQSR